MEQKNLLFSNRPYLSIGKKIALTVWFKVPPRGGGAQKRIKQNSTALFGVYADDLFSRWWALRGFRNTLKRRPRVATVAFDGRYMG